MAFDPISLELTDLTQSDNILQKISEKIKNFLGYSSAVLTKRPDGTELQDGDVYFNTKFGEYYLRINNKWRNIDTNFLIDNNGKLKTIDQKELSINNAEKLNNKTIDEVSEYTKSNILPIGNSDQVLFIKDDGSNNIYTDELVKSGKFSETDDQLDKYLNEQVSAEEIFNSWYRFSHDKTDNFPANSNELKAWKLNDDGTISCTLNTNTYVGFVSPDQYDYYELEVTLSSTNSDNDRMGVVLAFYKDPETGKEYTLSAIRNNDDDNYSWLVAYNFYNYGGENYEWDYTEKIIENKSNIIPRCSPDGWSNYNPGTVIKVQREGNIFRVWTSKCGSTEIIEDSLIEFNLDDYDWGDIFKGPRSYGFSARSQDNTTFSNIKFKNTDPRSISQYIFDIKNNKVYENQNNNYTEISETIENILSKNRYYKDINSKQLYFFDGKEFIKTGDISEFNIAENGYIKLKNGLIIQWGTVNLGSTSNGTNIFNVKFPITFPNKPLNIQVTSRENDDLNNTSQYFYEMTVSSTRMYPDSFDLRIIDTSNESSDVGINFIAIGY